MGAAGLEVHSVVPDEPNRRFSLDTAFGRTMVTDSNYIVVRTLLERSQNLVSEPEEKKKEDIHVQDALRTCGYPQWSLHKARRQMKQMKPKTKKTGCSSVKTFGGDSICRESFRDSSQDHEKIQCTLCYETMGHSQECLGTPQRS